MSTPRPAFAPIVVAAVLLVAVVLAPAVPAFAAGKALLAVAGQEAKPAAPIDEKTVAPLGTAPRQQPLLPARDSKQIGVFDGELSTRGIVDERTAAINEALQARDYEKAQRLLVEIAEAKPSPGVLRLLGGVFLAGGRPLNAAVALKKAEAIEPLDERSRFTLVMAYVAMGRADWARPELAKLVEAAPTNALYHYWTGRLDYDAQQYAAAIGSLQRAVQLDPALARAHDSLGLCYEALGRFDEAQRAWQEAIRLETGKPTRSPWPPLNLGLLLTRLDRLDEAEARFREAVGSDPGFAAAHYQLGLALEKKGRADEALAEIEEAARLDAASPEAQYALARLYRRAGDTAQAERALQRFEELRKEADRKAPPAAERPPGG
jgi:tetratricopeptide (TPR) repeat protein